MKFSPNEILLILSSLDQYSDGFKNCRPLHLSLGKRTEAQLDSAQNLIDKLYARFSKEAPEIAAQIALEKELTISALKYKLSPQETLKDCWDSRMKNLRIDSESNPNGS